MAEPVVNWARQVVGMWRTAIRGQLVYRASAVQAIISSAIDQSLQLGFLGLLLVEFGAIGTWSATEILLLFGVRSCAHAVYTIPFWQVQYIDVMLREGKFDHILHRPASPFVQVICGGFTIATLGDLVIGIAVLSAAISLGFDFTFFQWVFLIAAIISGGLVEAGLQIAVAATTFLLRETDPIRHLVEGFSSDLGGVPIDALGRYGAAFFTAVVPLAFVAYLPVAVVLGKPTHVPTWVAMSSPAVGPMLFASAVGVFNWLLRHYDSPNQ